MIRIKDVFLLGTLLCLASCVYHNEEEYFPIPDVTDTTEISLSVDVIPIVNTKCAIPGCHVSGAQSPDFTIKANIISKHDEISSRVQSGDMPKTGSLTQKEIDTIVHWVDQGAKDN